MRRTALIWTIWLLSGIAAAATTKYSYDGAGRLVRVEYGNGTTVTYTYDKSGNLLSREVTSASQEAGARSAQAARPAKPRTARADTRSSSRAKNGGRPSPAR